MLCGTFLIEEEEEAVDEGKILLCVCESNLSSNPFIIMSGLYYFAFVIKRKGIQFYFLKICQRQESCIKRIVKCVQLGNLKICRAV